MDNTSAFVGDMITFEDFINLWRSLHGYAPVFEVEVRSSTSFGIISVRVFNQVERDGNVILVGPWRWEVPYLSYADYERAIRYCLTMIANGIANVAANCSFSPPVVSSDRSAEQEKGTNENRRGSYRIDAAKPSPAASKPASTNGTARPISEKQKGLILSLCRSVNPDDDPYQYIRQITGKDIDDLSSPEASRLIDRLQKEKDEGIPF